MATTAPAFTELCPRGRRKGVGPSEEGLDWTVVRVSKDKGSPL